MTGSNVSRYQLLSNHFIYLCIIEDPENVVAIHCNSGKGRAGTACTCFLLYAGFYNNIKDCAKLFGARRFTDGKGVSQPCQVRFIHYFEAFYKQLVISPQIKILNKITIKTIPSGGCKLYYQVFQCEGLEITPLYDNFYNKEQNRHYKGSEKQIEYVLPRPQPLFGNIMISFRQVGTFKTSELFRITFNTAFIQKQNTMELDRLEISPEALHKDKTKFTDEFRVILEFDDFCKGKINSLTQRQIIAPCRSTTTKLEDICKDCRKQMGKEIKKWVQATDILAKHEKPTVEMSRQLIRNQDKFIEQAKAKKISW